jgi:phospholipid-translocating ATPase
VLHRGCYIHQYQDAVSQFFLKIGIEKANLFLSLLEMDNKTLVSVLGMALSVGGWFLWTIVMASIYKPRNDKAYLQYPLYANFLEHYGRDLSWWLNAFLILCTLVLYELAASSLRKAFWPTDTDVFQELEQDPIIRKRFEETVRHEQDGCVEEVEMGTEKKTSSEIEREGEIQALLDRPRVMDGASDAPNRAVSRSTTGSLLRRRVSTDINNLDIEMSSRTSAASKFRHSVDVAELCGRVK